MVLEAANPNHRVSESYLRLELADLTGRFRSNRIDVKPVKQYTGKFKLFRTSLFPRTVDYLAVDGDRVVAHFALDATKFKHLVVPHSMISEEYRGRGLAYSVYTFVLDSGLCFISSELQSAQANGVWRKLSSKYLWFLVDSGRYHGAVDQMTFLGQDPDKYTLFKPSTRIVMLGSGWSFEKFAKQNKLIGV